VAMPSSYAHRYPRSPYVAGNVQVVPNANGFGALVSVQPARGRLQPSPCFDPRTITGIQVALKHHLVVHVQGCSLAAMQDHLHFSERFGSVWPFGIDQTLYKVVSSSPLPAAMHDMREQQLAAGEPPAILKVFNLPNRTINGSMNAVFGWPWHTDNCFPNSLPPAFGVIVPRRMPPKGGGTRFLDMFQAFERLPPDLKERVALQRWPSNAKLNGTSSGDPPGFPSVLNLRGQHALYTASRGHLEAANQVMGANEAAARNRAFRGWELLDEVEKHLTRLWAEPNNSIYVVPGVGDVVLWDERATQHQAGNDYYGVPREVHRVLISRATWL